MAKIVAPSAILARRINNRQLGVPGSGGVRLTGGGLPWLLRDDFLTDAAAPLTSPRTAEPGPGTLTLVQTDGQFSISGGKLAFPAQTTPTWGDLGFSGQAQTRAAGVTLLTKIVRNQANQSTIVAAWGTAAAPTYTSIAGRASVYFENDGSLNLLSSGAAKTALGTYSAATTYTFALVLRAVGIFVLVKGGVFTSWTLLYLGNDVSTATLYPLFGNMAGTGTIDFLRVLDLPAPFNDDYGLATQRLAGARSAGDTFTHEANCIIEFTATTIPASGYIDIGFRRQDATHLWYVRVDAGGNLVLVEYDGTETVRGTSAGVIASGDRIVVIADGTTIRVYEANTLRITYASATAFATLTSGIVKQVAATAVVSDLITWPRTLTGSPASILDQVSG